MTRLAALLALLAAPAVAGTACGPRDKVLHKLQSAFGETRQSIGLGSNGSVVEVFASDDTGTWTVTVTTPDGRTCLIASGHAFEDLHDEGFSFLREDASHGAPSF